jgi:hypothetical protein
LWPRSHVDESCEEVVTDFFDSTRHACTCESYGGSVILIDPAVIRELLEAAIAGFSVLGGGMACVSGFHAERALAVRQGPALMAHRINEGIAEGFRLSWKPSIGALVIMAAS